ncbi:MAG: endonuclease III domain-containing protein [Candidatus Brocadiia bacterium]|jgi:endonuclease-3 related protein|nr:endonuclease III domain-containing protein [Candidatus Brocadiia bacterium]
MRIYEALLAAFGHRNWWPGETPFEVMVGAVLTQNTNWTNVEKAIANLKRSGVLSAAALSELDTSELQDLIRPAGYYRQKAGRLRRLARWVAERGADDACAIAALRAASTDELRQGLLALNGIGPETADSILLYALEKPVFVVDAYTVRIMSRHGLVDPEVGYEEVQAVFEDGLERDVELFKDYHAQLVEVGKRYCRRRSPRCERCPLRGVLGDPVLEEW